MPGIFTCQARAFRRLRAVFLAGSGATRTRTRAASLYPISSTRHERLAFLVVLYNTVNELNGADGASGFVSFPQTFHEGLKVVCEHGQVIFNRGRMGDWLWTFLQ